MGQSVGERIAIFRKSGSMKQAEFGKGLGLTGAAISAIELGKAPLTEGNIRLICLAYGVSEEWLRHGTGEMLDEQAQYEFEEEALMGLYVHLSTAAKCMLFEYAIKLYDDEAAVYGDGWWLQQPAERVPHALTEKVSDRINKNGTPMGPGDFEKFSVYYEAREDEKPKLQTPKPPPAEPPQGSA